MPEFGTWGWWLYQIIQFIAIQFIVQFCLAVYILRKIPPKSNISLKQFWKELEFSLIRPIYFRSGNINIKLPMWFPKVKIYDGEIANFYIASNCVFYLQIRRYTPYVLNSRRKEVTDNIQIIQEIYDKIQKELVSCRSYKTAIYSSELNQYLSETYLEVFKQYIKLK